MPLPVIPASQWYETLSLAEGVTLLSEPWMPPAVRCNMWIIEGSELVLLIDAGFGAVPMRREIPLLNRKPVTLLLSHTHFDHMGMACEFEERLVHSSEASIMASPTNEATLAARYVKAGEEQNLFWGLPEGWDIAGYCIAPAPATGLLQDGNRIDLGDRILTVLHTPGHSPGHLSLFEEATGILFAQDAVYDGRLIDDFPGSDVLAYISSLRRLREIEPSIVHPGHFGSLGPTRFRQIIDKYLDAH